MIDFQTLTLENFRKFESVTLPLFNQGLVLVEGQVTGSSAFDSNSSGKSSLLTGIVWVLYGKLFKSPGKDEVVNHKAGKNCRVSITFKKDGIEYRITRHRKYDKFQNSVLVEDLTSGTNITQKDVQDQIDKLIGMSFNLFGHCVFFGQGVTKRFTSLGDGEKKAVIEEIQGIERFRLAVLQLNKQLSELDKKILEITTKRGLLEQGIADKKEFYRTQEHIHNEFLQEQKEELERLEQQVILLNSELVELAKEQVLVENEISLYTQAVTDVSNSATLEEREMSENLSKLEVAIAKATPPPDTRIEQFSVRTEEVVKEQKKLAANLFLLKAQQQTKLQQKQVVERQLAVSAYNPATFAAVEKQVETSAHKQTLLETEKLALEEKNAKSLEVRAALTAKLEGADERISQLTERLNKIPEGGTGKCTECESDLGAAHFVSKIEKYTQQKAKWEAESLKELHFGAPLTLRISEILGELKKIRELNTTWGAMQLDKNQYEARKEHLKQLDESLQGLVKQINENSESASKLEKDLLELKLQAGDLSKSKVAAEEQVQKLGVEKATLLLEWGKRKLELATSSNELKAYLNSQVLLKEELVTKLSTKRATRTAFKQQSVALAERVSPTNLPKLESGIAQAEIELNDVVNLLATLASSQVYKTIARDTLDRKGLPSMLLDSQVAALAGSANHYAQRLTDGEIEIGFSTTTIRKDSGEAADELQVIVTSRGGGEKPDENSGGEERRADLCIAFALRDLAMSRTQTDIRLSVYDEALESMDATGSERVAALLKDEAQQGTTFVITHNKALVDHFQKVWTVIGPRNEPATLKL